MRYLLFLSLLSFSAFALSAKVCPDAKHCLLGEYYSVPLVSVYQDSDKCTQPLLYDGVCPDYLIGGCAQLGDCKQTQKRQPVVFGDNR